MGLPAFDDDRHHIGLGETAETLFGFVLHGGYRRNLQASPTPQAFGGTTDFLNNPVLARWTQEDFSGGSFKYQWGSDNAMFAYCTGMAPVLDAKSVRTVAPLIQESAKNDTTSILHSFVYDGALYLVRPTVVQKCDLETSAWTETAIPGADTAAATAACFDRADKRLYIFAGKAVRILTVPELLVPAREATVTVTIASPAVFTLAAHGLSVGDRVSLSTSVDPDAPSNNGALPTGLAADTVYWIVEVPTADTFKVSAEKGGTAIDTTGTQKGTHTLHYRNAADPVGTKPSRASYTYPTDKDITSIKAMFTGKQFLSAITDRNRLFTVQIPTDKAVDAAWTEIISVPGEYRGDITFNGQTYILLSDDYDGTQLVSFDGANLLPITEFPYNFKGECLQAYGGKVYVGGSGRQYSGGTSYPEFYEVTGATLRLVKTFTPERNGGEATPFEGATAIRSLAVHEGLLHLGFDNYGLVAYDLTTDSLYGASQLQDTGVADPTFELLFSANQTVHAYVGSSVAAKRGLYRVATPADTVGPYVGQLVSSDFAPQPEAMKRWSQIHVLTRYGDCDVEYSVDGGASYVNLPATQTVEGGYVHTLADLASVPVSKRVRFRLSFPRDAESETYTELVAFTVGFLFLASGKRVWSVTINAADRLHAVGLDEGIVQDPAAIGAQLFTWASERTPLLLHDLDDSLARVNITRCEDAKPVITAELSDGRGFEALYSVTLTEV